MTPSLGSILFSVGLLAAVAATAAAALRAGRAAWLPAIGLTALFAAATQLPLPGSGGPDCHRGGPPPLWEPMRFVEGVSRRLHQELSPAGWLRDLTISAPALNFHACAAIGMALALCLPRLRQAALFGALLSGTAETAQITGVFGLYPCPYRQFETDDLILNIGGVAIGFLLARALGVVPAPRRDGTGAS